MRCLAAELHGSKPGNSIKFHLVRCAFSSAPIRHPGGGMPRKLTKLSRRSKAIIEERKNERHDDPAAVARLRRQRPSTDRDTPAADGVHARSETRHPGGPAN